MGGGGLLGVGAARGRISALPLGSARSMYLRCVVDGFLFTSLVVMSIACSASRCWHGAASICLTSNHVPTGARSSLQLVRESTRLYLLPRYCRRLVFLSGSQ